MRYIAIGILLIALTSCAESYYVKPGATVADFDVDKEDCVKKASNASMAAGYGTYPPSQPNVNAMAAGYGTYSPSQPNQNAMDMVDQCLSQRGWRKATASETAEIERRQQQQKQQP